MAPERLLVYRPGAIGDFILALPALAALRARFPRTPLTVVGPAVALPLALDAGLADDAFGADDPRLTALFAAAEASPPASLRPSAAVLWAGAAAAPFASQLRKLEARELIHVPGRPALGARQHVADYLFGTLRPLGVMPMGPAIPRVVPSQPARAAAARFLAERAGETVGPATGYTPGRDAAWPRGTCPNPLPLEARARPAWGPTCAEAHDALWAEAAPIAEVCAGAAPDTRTTPYYSATGSRGMKAAHPSDLLFDPLQRRLGASDADARPAGRWVALHVGSGSPRKNWPAARFAAVGGALGQVGFRPLLVAGPAEVDDVDQVAAALAPWRPLIARDWPLESLAGLLAYCVGYVGADSGITHLAAAVGTPVAAVFGPTDPALWAPRGPHVTILRRPVACQPCTWEAMWACPHRACLTELGPEAVVAAAVLRFTGRH